MPRNSELPDRRQTSREDAIGEFELAVALSPNSASAHSYLGVALMHADRAKDAIPHMELAIRLSPSNPEIGAYLTRLAGAYILAQKFEQSVEWARNAVQRTNVWNAHAYLCASLANLARDGDARRARERLEEIQPRIGLDFVRTFYPADKPQMELLLEGLRRAGLPV
jgi:tetratricopeptide (TPR) repeat protein